MSYVFCFYSDLKFKPHLNIALSSFRKYHPKEDVFLVAVDQSFSDLKRRYDLNIKKISIKDVPHGRLNWIKSRFLDWCDYERIIHYDADFLFNESVVDVLDFDSDKIQVCIATSKGKQNPQKIAKLLNYVCEICDDSYKFGDCKMYNAGFFVASRCHHNLFDKWAELMSMNTEYHSRFAAMDQYIFNYLAQKMNFFMEVPLAYNCHSKFPLAHKKAIHFANDHLSHLLDAHSYLDSRVSEKEFKFKLAQIDKKLFL